MGNSQYVYRDIALTQTIGGRWGIIPILISLFVLGITLTALITAPSQEGSFETLILYWFCSIFMLIGLHQGYFGFKALIRELTARFYASKKRPQWQQDYRWQSNGGTYSSIKKLLVEYMKGLFFLFFLAPFVYLVFFRDAETSELWVKLVVGIFVLALGLIIYSLRTAWLYHFLYGNTQLKWDQFPLLPGIPFSLELINPRMLGKHQSLDISVRYIRETWVTSGSGDSRSNKLQFLCLYDYRQSYEVSHNRLHLQVCLPQDAPTNVMTSSPSCYWELVVHNDKELKWQSYLAWFFLPVYLDHKKAEKVLA